MKKTDGPKNIQADGSGAVEKRRHCGVLRDVSVRLDPRGQERDHVRQLLPRQLHLRLRGSDEPHPGCRSGEALHLRPHVRKTCCELSNINIKNV